MEKQTSKSPTSKSPTGKSTELFARAQRVAPGGVHSPVRGFRGVGGIPRFIESALGSRISDVDGNSYTDYCMSWGPLLFGHRDEEVLDAVQTALGRGWSYGAAEPYSLELAELITSKIPWVEKVRFVSSGTEAVMSALRVARGATGRDKILKFDGCYHGHVDSMLVHAGSGLAEMASPDSAGVSRATAAETIVAPLDDIPALEAIFTAHGREIAAVIVEPMPANNGLLLQTEDFLKSVVALARRNGSLVIFDEVISGFRVAFGGMAERTGLRPDLVTYGKVLGGGFPMAAYGGRKELLDLVAPAGPVYQAGTLSANPVAVAAGLAMLKKLSRDDPYAALESKVEAFAARVERDAWAKGLELKIQHLGSVFWPVFANKNTPVIRAISNIPARQKEAFALVFHELLNQGIYLAPSGYEVSFLSTVHTDKDIEELATALLEAYPI